MLVGTSHQRVKNNVKLDVVKGCDEFSISGTRESSCGYRFDVCALVSGLLS